MASKRKILALVIIALVLVSILLIAFYPKKDSFTVKTVLIKLNIPAGGDGASILRIVNNEDIYEEFNIRFQGIEDFVSFNDTRFKLAPNEFKEIEVIFKDTKNKPGVYLGKVIIENTILKKEIPVIISIDDPQSFFIITQRGVQKYSEVYPGGKFGIEIKVFDTSSTGASTVKAKYYIENFDKEILWSESGDLIVEGGITKIINIPNDWSYGDYVFVTSIDYDGKKSTSNYLLTVSKKQGGLFSTDIKILLGVVFFFVLAILILFFYFIKTRDDLLIQLKKQQDRELERNFKLINIYRKETAKLKNLQERKRKISKLRKTKEKIVSEIKSKQKIQKEQFKKLKKLGKKDELKSKLMAWEKQGYKMPEIEKEMKKISKKGIPQQIKEWRKKGYDVNFLTK